MIESETIGQLIARCNVVRMLSETMTIQKIATGMKYEEDFVNAIVELLKANPDASDEEIAEKWTAR